MLFATNVRERGILRLYAFKMGCDLCKWRDQRKLRSCLVYLKDGCSAFVYMTINKLQNNEK